MVYSAPVSPMAVVIAPTMKGKKVAPTPMKVMYIPVLRPLGPGQ